MLMFVQVKYQLRSRGRSVLVLCIAALLAACMAFYVENIGVNKAALQSLSDSVPVTVRITSRNGAKTAGLNIEAKPFDHLTEAGVHDVRCTAVAAGAFSPEVRAQEMFLGGDTIVRAGNSLEALELSADNLHFADGQSAAFLSGDSAQCVIGEDYAERTGLHPGDTLSLEIYTVRQSMNGTIYQMIGDAALEIIGTHSAPGGADVILPVNFLRTEAETAGVLFLYDSCSALVDDSTHLKDFKAEMQKYFMDINPSAEDPNAGDALSVEDELFVKTASRLRQNIALFQSMLVPFFALIIGLVVLTTSFMLPNGTIESFDAALRVAVPETSELTITYDDNGYGDLMTSLNNARMSAVLLFAGGLIAVVGIVVLLLYFFIVKQKKRTAIERSLGMSKAQCRRSLMAGILVLALVASVIGVGIGAVLLQSDVLTGTAQSETEEIDTTFSIWAKGQTEVTEPETDATVPVAVYVFIPVCLLVFIFLLSLVLVNRNLKTEPILLLSGKGE